MPEANGRAVKSATTFRSETGVAIRIAAPATKIWSLLTNARDFPRWNSTVKSIDGDIALGSKLAVRVPISPRTFRPKVIEFAMVEVLSGLMLPMIKKSLPDFGPPFDRYATDLKREAERSAK